METREYYCKVWSRGIEDAKKYYREDRRAWWYNIGSAVLAAIITPYVYSKIGLIVVSQLGFNILAGLISGVLIFCAFMGIVFLYHLVNSPVRIHREVSSNANLFTFENIKVRGNELQNKNYWRFSVEVENTKPYEVVQLAFEILYLEIDGEVVYRRPSRNYQYYTGHRLARIDTNQLDTHGQTLEVGTTNSKINLALFDRVGDKYRVQYASSVPGKTDFVARDAFFSKSIRGELHLIAKVQNHSLSSDSGVDEYCFSANLESDSVKASLAAGKLEYRLNNQKESDD